MIVTIQTYNRQLAIRLAIVLLIFALLGTALALLVRKAQSQRQLLALHTKILANLPRMQTETVDLQQQLQVLQQALPADLAGRSPELHLYKRLDQIKSTLQPTEMTVTGPEIKDGVQTIGFNLKVPFSRYNALINGMGQLQTGLFPFVDFREIHLTPTATDATIGVVGNVILPPPAGGKP